MPSSRLVYAALSGNCPNAAVFGDLNGTGFVDGDGWGTIFAGFAEVAVTAESIRKGHLVKLQPLCVLRQSGELCRVLGTENEGRYSQKTGSSHRDGVEGRFGSSGGDNCEG